MANTITTASMTALYQKIGNTLVKKFDYEETIASQTASATHIADTGIHLTAEQSLLLTKMNHFQGGFATSEALVLAHATGNEGDFALVYATDTVWVWDAQATPSAKWIDSGTKGSVTSVNGKTGEIIISLQDIGLAAGTTAAQLDTVAAKSTVVGKMTEVSGKLAYDGTVLGNDLISVLHTTDLQTVDLSKLTEDAIVVFTKPVI